MTALSAVAYPKSRNLGLQRTYLMTASKTIYGGGLVMIVAAGTAEAAAAAANNQGVVGVAIKTYTSAASGAYYVTVQEGEFLLAATTAAQTIVSAKVYAEDDQTVDETQDSDEPLAGLCTEYVSASAVWVDISLVNSKL